MKKQRDTMKILLVTDAFPPHAGGSGWSTYQLAKSLLDKGHEIRIVKQGKREQYKYNEFIVHQYGTTLPVFKEFRHLFLRKGIERIIHRWKPDIIHAQHIVSCRALALVNHPRKICTVRDHWPIFYDGTWFNDKTNTSFTKENDYFETLQSIRAKFTGIIKLLSPLVALYMVYRTNQAKKALQAMNEVICVSSYVEKMLKKVIEKRKLHVIPNMITIAEDAIGQQKKSGKIKVLYIGKLTPMKGSHYLAEAITLLSELIQSKMELTFVGEGHLKDLVKKYLKKTTSTYFFKGYVSNPEIQKMLQSSDIFVSASLSHDTLSRSLLEALANGCPTIATDVGGSSDIVQNKENGLLVKPTPRALADAIQEFIQHPGMSRKYAQVGIQTIKNSFSPRVVIPQYLALYKSS